MIDRSRSCYSGIYGYDVNNVIDFIYFKKSPSMAFKVLSNEDWETEGFIGDFSVEVNISLVVMCLIGVGVVIVEFVVTT